MNKEDIIRMAREAGILVPGYRDHIEHMERFAALVSAAERESMIEQGWRQCAKGQRTTQFCGIVEQAIKEEREACANECEHTALRMGSEWMAHHCAAAIRARGQA